MITVYKTDTGQHVLIHAPTQTVMIHADLKEGFEKICAHLKKNHPEFEKQMIQPFERGGAATDGGGWRWGMFLTLAALPFLWLGVLHYSLGTMMSDVVVQMRGINGRSDGSAADAQAVEALRVELNKLGAAFDKLSGAAGPDGADIARIKDDLKTVQTSLNEVAESAKVTRLLLTPQEGAPNLREDVMALRQAVDQAELVPQPGQFTLRAEVTALYQYLDKMSAEFKALSGRVAALENLVPPPAAPPQP